MLFAISKVLTMQVNGNCLIPCWCVLLRISCLCELHFEATEITGIATEEEYYSSPGVNRSLPCENQESVVYAPMQKVLLLYLGHCTMICNIYL